MTSSRAFAVKSAVAIVGAAAGESGESGQLSSAKLVSGTTMPRWIARGGVIVIDVERHCVAGWSIVRSGDSVMDVECEGHCAAS